ncbi:hypothetical protein FRC01_001121 [Tulasnella sp. 417]|nr:hypothetical protein FRC01_001121 [Tulasnella sp. 417]
MPLTEREMQRKLHALSMREKVTVSRVSKLWREISKEFLFNSIRVHHTLQIPLLGRAFRADEARMGGLGARGTAPCWVRELWIDLDDSTIQTHFDSKDLNDLPKFSLSKLLKRCPSIVVFRGFGRGPYQKFGPRFHTSQILGQILRTNVEEDSSSSGELPHNSHSIELNLFVPGDPFLHLLPPPSNTGATPQQLVLSSVRYLELSPTFHPIEIGPPRGAFILPNLEHLTVSGTVAATYATKLEMPRLRGVTYLLEFFFNPPANEPFLQLLTKYGAGLNVLTIPYKTSRQVLDHVGMHCTNLQSFTANWEQVAECPPGVTTVAVVGLEDVVYQGQSRSAIIALGALIDAAPALQEVRDLSWRSSVVRKRTARNCNSQDAPPHAQFWSEVCRIFGRSGSGVRLVDWRGRVIDPVREMEMDDDDRFMDEVVGPAVIWGW